MKIWYVNFTNGSPHYSVAYVEAATEKAARARLREYVDKCLADEYYDDTVYKDAILPEEQWEVILADRPFMYVLGSGCR